jgi:hypothetical protein
LGKYPGLTQRAFWFTRGQGWWVAGGEGGGILISTNAMQWSRAQTQVSSSLVWSSYAGERFFLTGSEGVLLTSPNVLPPETGGANGADSHLLEPAPFRMAIEEQEIAADGHFVGAEVC